ncbi:MAG: hypothetical protein ACE5FT_06795 [Candidatus Nanoarchaeia archaeon]
MVTTIQVKEETLETLKLIRRQTKSKSYDETIHHLIARKGSKSKFGVLGKKPMSEILKDLRDKHDCI